MIEAQELAAAFILVGSVLSFCVELCDLRRAPYDPEAIASALGSLCFLIGSVLYLLPTASAELVPHIMDTPRTPIRTPVRTPRGRVSSMKQAYA